MLTTDKKSGARAYTLNIDGGELHVFAGRLVLRQSSGRLVKRFNPAEALLFLALLDSTLKLELLELIRVGGDFSARFELHNGKNHVACLFTIDGSPTLFRFGEQAIKILLREFAYELGSDILYQALDELCGNGDCAAVAAMFSEESGPSKQQQKEVEYVEKTAPADQ